MSQILHNELFDEAKQHYLTKTYQADFEVKSNGVHPDAQLFFFTAQKLIGDKLQTNDEGAIRTSFRDFYNNYLEKKYSSLIGNLFNGKGFHENTIPEVMEPKVTNEPTTEGDEPEEVPDKKHWYDDI